MLDTLSSDCSCNKLTVQHIELLISPQLEKGQPLPTPTDLRGKILIKNRKQKTDPHKKRSGR